MSPLELSAQSHRFLLSQFDDVLAPYPSVGLRGLLFHYAVHLCPALVYAPCVQITLSAVFPRCVG